MRWCSYRIPARRRSSVVSEEPALQPWARRAATSERGRAGAAGHAFPPRRTRSGAPPEKHCGYSLTWSEAYIRVRHYALPTGNWCGWGGVAEHADEPDTHRSSRTADRDVRIGCRRRQQIIESIVITDRPRSVLTSMSGFSYSSSRSQTRHTSDSGTPLYRQ